MPVWNHDRLLQDIFTLSMGVRKVARLVGEIVVEVSKMVPTIFLVALLVMQTANSADTFISDFNSADWIKRAAATQALAKTVQADNTWFGNAAIRNALAELISRENEGIYRRYESGEGTSEGISEYYSEDLIPLALSLIHI